MYSSEKRICLDNKQLPSYQIEIGAIQVLISKEYMDIRVDPEPQPRINNISEEAPQQFICRCCPTYRNCSLMIVFISIWHFISVYTFFLLRKLLVVSPVCMTIGQLGYWSVNTFNSWNLILFRIFCCH